MNKMISIIVPVFCADKYLNTCVDSLIHQTYHDLEIILVDDGSIDRSSEICDEYSLKDQRIKVIHKENGGATSARTRGIIESTGEYIAFVDADDWLERDFFERFIHAIDKYEPDILCCGETWVEEKKKKYLKFHINEGLYSKEEIVKYMYPSLITSENDDVFSPGLLAKVFKKDIIYKSHLDLIPDIKIGEDFACVVNCLYHANTIFIFNDCLYNYRQVATSITKQKKARRWDDPKDIFDYLSKHINLTEKDFEMQIKRFVTHQLFAISISQFARKKTFNEIKKDISINISRKFYQDCLMKSNFVTLKGKIIKYVLLHKKVHILRLFYRR